MVTSQDFLLFTSHNCYLSCNSNLVLVTNRITCGLSVPQIPCYVWCCCARLKKIYTGKTSAEKIKIKIIHCYQRPLNEYVIFRISYIVFSIVCLYPFVNRKETGAEYEKGWREGVIYNFARKTTIFQANFRKN